MTGIRLKAFQKVAQVATTVIKPSTKVAAKKLPDKNVKAVMPKKKINN